MREAPALAGVTGPRSRPMAPRRPKRPAEGGWRTSLVGRAFARPGVTVAGAVFAALMTGIIVNAVFFQSGHRPSSLFGSARQAEIKPPTPPAPPVIAKIVTAPAAIPAAPTVAAAPPPAPSLGAAPPPVPTPVVARTQPAPKPVSQAKTTALHSRSDSIARLLGTLGVENRVSKTAETEPAKPKSKPASQKVKPVASARATPQN